jgi:hypothetical protein
VGNKARIGASVKERYSYRADAKEPKKECEKPRRPALSISAIGAKSTTCHKQAYYDERRTKDSRSGLFDYAIGRSCCSQIANIILRCAIARICCFSGNYSHYCDDTCDEQQRTCNVFVIHRKN